MALTVILLNIFSMSDSRYRVTRPTFVTGIRPCACQRRSVRLLTGTCSSTPPIRVHPFSLVVAVSFVVIYSAFPPFGVATCPVSSTADLSCRAMNRKHDADKRKNSNASICSAILTANYPGKVSVLRVIIAHTAPDNKNGGL